MTSIAQPTERHAITRPMATLLMVAAVCLWGTSAALAKLLFTRDYTPLMITQTRTTLSFLLLVPWFLLRDRTVFRLRRRDIPLVALVGVIGLAFTNFTYYYTVHEASVASAILIQYTAPALVMLYMVFVARTEKGSALKAGALVLALVGCVLAVKGEGVSLALPGWSAVTGPATAFSFAILIIGSKALLHRYSQWTVLLYAFGGAGAFWLFVHPPWVIASEGYSWGDWGIFAMFAVVSVLVPYILFTASLKRLDASTVGILGTLEPVVAIVAAWLIVGEGVNVAQVIGGVAIIGAVSLLQMTGEGAEVPEEHA